MRSPFLVVLLVFLPFLATSQSSDELKTKYGQPFNESFLVAPKIALAASYTSEGEVCRIDTHYPWVEGNVYESTLMPTESVSAIIDELVPPSGRGEAVMHTTASGCNTHTVSEYATVTISRTQHNCEPDSPDRDVSARITYKGRQCAVKSNAAPYVSDPERTLFEQAMAAFEAKHFDLANIKFQTIVNTYPDSDYAHKAKLALEDPRLANCGQSFNFFSQCDGVARGDAAQ